MALLRRAVAIAPLDLGVKRNLIAVLWDAQLFAEFCQASRELLAQIGVSLDSPERAADPNFHFVERRARFDVADSAQRHRCSWSDGRRRVSVVRVCAASPIRRCEIVDRVRRRRPRQGFVGFSSGARERRAYTLAASGHDFSWMINGINLSSKRE